MTRVFTADGPGVVTETDTRHGTTWLYIEGAAMSGWYPAREVTADIGDPGRDVTSPEDFPDPEDGTRLPYDPRPRDVFHNQLTIQPTSDLPPNLTPTDSINGLRYTEPNAVFGSTHPFGKQANARHFANADNGEYVDLGHDFDLDDDAPYNKEQIDATEDSPYPHVPSEWKDKPPGVGDYGPDYDKKNPQVVNPLDDDGPFKTAAEDYLSDLPKQPGAHGGPAPITPPPDPYQWEEQGDGRYPKQAEFVDHRDPGWNDKASEDFLDNPFTREDKSENDGDEEFDFYREAGALDALEHLWWGDDYEWLKGMGREEDPKQQDPRRPNQDPNARDVAYAAIDGVSNDEGGNDFNDVMDPQVQQVPWDPSHGMTPDGDMQVFSPEVNDADPAGQLQSILSDDPMEELAEEIVDHFQGTDDPLQGVEVPHQLDVDDEMAGMEVPHQGPMGAGEVGAADNLEDVGPTGNVPIGPYADNDELAHMAQTFLARTSAKNYSDAEQAALMNEAGVAAQLPSLRLSDSIYEESDVMFTL